MRSLFYVPGNGPFGVTTWEETYKMMLGERYKAYARGKSEKQIKDWVYCRFTVSFTFLRVLYIQERVRATLKISDILYRCCGQNWLEGFVNKSSEHPREQQYWTVLARAFAFSIKLSSQSPLDGMITTGERHRLLYEDPFGFLAWIEVDKMPDMASWYDAPWWSTFQHRALLLVASLVAEYKNNEWNLAEKTWISSDHSKHAIMEAGFLSEEIISRTHLKEANMITDLNNRMMEEIGLKKSCNHTRDCQGCGRVKPLFESSPY